MTTNTIDTSNWVFHDNLDDLTNAALTTYATNNTNFYTLLETENATFAGETQEGEQGTGNFNRYRRYRWDMAQVPFLRSNIPTHGESDFVTYNGYSHGKSVRPYQGLQWTGPAGQHIHMMPTIDNISLEWTRRASDSEYILGGTGRRMNIQFGMQFWYSSLTNNYAFPNFNDAAPEFDIYIWNADNLDNWIRVENYPITTTGAPATIVLALLRLVVMFCEEVELALVRWKLT